MAKPNASRPVLKVPAVAAPVPSPTPVTRAPAATTTWSCLTATLDAKGQAGAPVSEPLTVGQTFVVTCEGAAAPLRADQIFLLPPKENPYALRLLQLREMSPAANGLNKVSFVATTYVASEKGPLPISGYALSDGQTSVALAPLQLQSRSVITQEKNPERKPYGPLAPVTIGYPLWFWLLLAAFFGLVAGAVGWIIVRRNEYRKFIAELEKETSLLSPYNQFNKELRSLARLGVVTENSPWTAERAKEMLATLRAALLWYIAREFEIPAHKVSAEKTVERLSRLRARRLGPRFQADEKEIATSLRELERALAHPAAVSLGEIQQLSELCRQTVERLNKWPFTRASVQRAKKPEVTP